MSWNEALSLPDDPPRLVALVIAALAPLWAPRLMRARVGSLWWRAAPLAALLLSVAYVVHYLRGGPRIIDATSYWLEARLFGEGMASIPLDEPEQGVLGRFLLRSDGSGRAVASVIFPPGYPAVLAVGFVLGAPMLVGPLLGCALVLATAALARSTSRLSGPFALGALGSRAVGESALAGSCEPELMWSRYAALASVLCAALRYHTADTMAHGLAALCFATSLLSVLSAAERGASGAPTWRPLLASGVALGWLFATRPASSLALMVAITAMVGHPAVRRLVGVSSALVFAAGTMPGLALWGWYQHAATGDVLGSAQHAYYAVSDGPPGCFRYGFGAGVGCLGEHGDFVRANLAHGYDVVAAAATTGRRLKLHLEDALNFAPLFPLILWGAWSGRRAPIVRAVALGVVAQVAVYAPFYFDGNYPGGGARMFADVLPCEHVLAGLGVVALPTGLHLTTWRNAAAALALSLFGFAFRTGALHRELQSREGGWPMFRPDATTALGVGDGDLVFVDTDHAFNLAFDPSARMRVARYRGDALDLMTWERAGRPRSFRQRYEPYAHGNGRIERWPLAAEPEHARIEAESLWPPLEQLAGWVWPAHTTAPCASGGGSLLLRPASDGGMSATLALPATLAGRSLRVVVIGSDDDVEHNVIIDVISDGESADRAATWAGRGARCHRSRALMAPAATERLRLRIETSYPTELDVVIAEEIR